MKTYNNGYYQNDTIDEKIYDLAYFSYNFNKMPPIIGIITADKFGNTLMVFEYDEINNRKYSPIKSYLSENDKNLLEIDLISMYFSSLKSFAGQTNIQNLSNLEIHGSNMKIQIYFLLDKFMVILFLNSKVDLNLKKKKQIINYFENMLITHEFEFEHYNASNAREIIRSLVDRGKLWLKKLNNSYIQTFQNAFKKKHEILEMVMNEITPLIETELSEYLGRIPEDIKYNMTKELRNKIQDKISEFNLDLDKN